MTAQNMNPGQLRLKRARKEIEAILKKHDIAGYITLHAPDAGEVFWNIWPTYSKLIGEFPSIRIKSKLADYGGNQEKQKRDLALTAQMIDALATTMGPHAMMFLELAGILNAKTGAEHTEGVFTPDPSKHNPGTH